MPAMIGRWLEICNFMSSEQGSAQELYNDRCPSLCCVRVGRAQKMQGAVGIVILVGLFAATPIQAAVLCANAEGIGSLQVRNACTVPEVLIDPADLGLDRDLVLYDANGGRVGQIQGDGSAVTYAATFCPASSPLRRVSVDGVNCNICITASILRPFTLGTLAQQRRDALRPEVWGDKWFLAPRRCPARLA